MTVGEVITVIALIAGPVIAVSITLWAQNRGEKRKAKQQLFMTLMGHRKSIVPTHEWATALNLIDVIYADNPSVVEKWHDAYDILDQRQAGTPRWNHAYLNLLSDMAKTLGYKSLSQTDIDKFYVPQGLGDQSNLQGETQRELLRVLKASEAFALPPRTPQN